MKDQLVGQLWKQWFMPVPLEELSGERAAIILLIRKLVEERAWNVAKEYCDREERAKMLSCVNAALRDFGIDPETWK